MLSGNSKVRTLGIWVSALLLTATLLPTAIGSNDSPESDPAQETWSSLWEGDGVNPPGSEGWWVREYGATSILSAISDGETVAIVDDADSNDGAWMQKWVNFTPPFKLATRARYDPTTPRQGPATIAYLFTGCHVVSGSVFPDRLRITGRGYFDVPATQGTWYNLTFDVKAYLDVDVYVDGLLVGNIEMPPRDTIVFDQPANKPVIVSLNSAMAPLSRVMVDYMRTTTYPIEEGDPRVCDRVPPLVLNVTLDDGLKQPSNDLLVSESASTVWLNATIDDTTTGNSSIWSANYTVNASNWPGTSMDPVDLSFDSPIEDVTSQIDVSGLTEGNYTLCVYGRDYNGNSNLSGSCATMRIGNQEPPRICNLTLDDGIQPPSSFLEVPLLPGTIVWLNATIDDTLTGNSRISMANYTIGPQAWPGIPIAPADGTFDSSVENVTAPLDPYSLGEGNHTLCVYASDIAGNANLSGPCGYLNISYQASASQVNPIAPYWWNGQIVITASSTNGSFPVDSVDLYYDYSADNTSWLGWSYFDTAVTTPWAWSFSSPEGDGHYGLYSIARDSGGVEETAPFGADTIAGYDATAPASSMQPLVPYWWSTDTVDLTADAADALSGVATVTFLYRFSVDNTSWTVWIPASVDNAPPYETVFVASEGDGYYEFYSRAEDLAGNSEAMPPTADAFIAVDMTSPAGYIVINTDDAWTNAASVNLALTFSDALSGVSQVRYSNDGTFDTEPWEAPSGAKSWILSGGDGVKTVWYQVADGVGNSHTTFDDIGLDTTPPVSMLDPLSSYWFAGTSVPLSAQASDALSGVDAVELLYRWSADNITFTPWTSVHIDSDPPWSFSLDAPEGDGFYELMTSAVDVAGNSEASVLVEISLAIDATPPTTEALPVVPYARTDMPVVVDAVGSDALSGMATMRLMYRYSETNSTWSSWQSLEQITSPPFEWNFSAPDGEGYYEFYTLGRDVLGNTELEPEDADARLAHFTQWPPPGDEDGVQENWKPFLALAFIVIILVTGFALLGRRKIKGLPESRTKALLAVAVLFSVLEAVTAIVSTFTPALAIPPILGAGTLIDVAILLVGLAILILLGTRRGVTVAVTADHASMSRV